MARITHRNDRMHRGLVPTDQLGTGSASSSTVLLGNQTWGSVPGTAFGSNSNSVGSANAPGASSSNARADHVHQGVHRLTANGSNALFEDVNVAAGSGIGITQSGQTVTITNTGSSSGGGSGTLTTIEEVDASPTDSAVTKLVFPNGTLSIASHVATYTPTASGGSLSMPSVIQAVASSGVNTTNPTLTIAAAASGDRLVLGVNLVGRASTSVTCTNVTWTKIVGTATSAGSSRYELWVGVVAGGSSGTTITVNTGSSNFASLVAMEVTDALTPTVVSSYSAAFPSTTQLFGPLTATAGHLLIWFVGADNTTNAIQIFPWSPAQPFWRAATGTGATLAVGYAPSGPTGASALNSSGSGWAMIAEVT
jgi:hypothetical protein